MKKTMISVTAMLAVIMGVSGDVFSQKTSAPLQGQADKHEDLKQHPRQQEDIATGGAIRFTGMVTSPTCVINGGNGAENFNVDLPVVMSSQFASTGKTAGDTVFKISLSGCGGAGTRVRANFQQGMMVDSASGRLNIDRTANNAAGNIQVELASRDSDVPVIVGTDQQSTSYFPIDKNGNADLVYVARYYATGKIKAGRVNTQVTYVLQYQ